MDLLRGKTLLKKNGDSFQEIPATDALKNAQIVGFYFSAHWCVPCRSFTPCLVDCYQELRAKKKPFEIVFVSADESPESAKTYMKEAHGEWMSTVFEDTDLHDALAKTFAVIRIPQLVIVKRNGQMITSNGCRDVKELGGDAFTAWLDGKSAIRSQEHLGIDEDLLEKLAKRPTSKLKTRITGSKVDLVANCPDPTGPCGDETDELSKSLEKAGIKTSNTEKDKIKSNPTRMLTIRDVEKNATESSATSSNAKKGIKDIDRGAIPKLRTIQKENEDIAARDTITGGVMHKEAIAASSKKTAETNTDVKDKAEIKGRLLHGEGGSTETEKSEKVGKSDSPRKRKRHPKKKSTGSKDKDKDKDETKMKSDEKKISDF